MPKRDAFAEEVDDRLASLDGYRRRAMFGGHGLFQHKTFFGIVFRGRLYFRTTPATSGEVRRRGHGAVALRREEYDVELLRGARDDPRGRR